MRNAYFGGPYSNLHAAKALIAYARKRDIPASKLICTGDVMAYAVHRAETWKLIHSACATIVAWNCEKQLEAGAHAMVQAGLTQRYETALGFGIWPSEDVLPESLRYEVQITRQAGVYPEPTP